MVEYQGHIFTIDLCIVALLCVCTRDKKDRLSSSQGFDEAAVISEVLLHVSKFITSDL